MVFRGNEKHNQKRRIFKVRLFCVAGAATVAKKKIEGEGDSSKLSLRLINQVASKVRSQLCVLSV